MDLKSSRVIAREKVVQLTLLALQFLKLPPLHPHHVDDAREPNARGHRKQGGRGR